MKRESLYNNMNKTMRHIMLLAIISIIPPVSTSAIAAVAVRDTSRATPASSRMPTMATKYNRGNQVATSNSTSDTTVTTNTSASDTSGTTGTASTGGTTQTTNTPDYSNEIIENKSDQFESVVEEMSGTATDASTTSLAEMIRQQRAALDAAANEEFGNKNSNGVTAGLSDCDRGLRSCMQEKCGRDFLKCAGDGDTDFGMKLDSCRRNIKCSAHEFLVFGAEIKADRDMNLRLESYQKIIDCGNRYNSCIEQECTATFTKCLGKPQGDAAIAKCESIAKECVEQDSGLAGRTMNVFATLRLDAEKQVRADEQRLYEMRDKMANTCQRLGAMFDQRTLDCVFTVNFWAGDNQSVPMASKKLYAGSTFDCTQDWFGIDVTTFKENAYRTTRDQKSATAAFMGAGIGTAVGSITSGMLDRAIDRNKAEKALKKAEREDAGEDTESNKSCQGLKDGDTCTKRILGLIKTTKGVCKAGKCVTPEDKDDNANANESNASANGQKTEPTKKSAGDQNKAAGDKNKPAGDQNKAAGENKGSEQVAKTHGEAPAAGAGKPAAQQQ